MSDAQSRTVAEPAATQTFSTRTGSLPPNADLSILPEVPGYEIVRLIGRGGMGIVYEARDQRLQRTVALKMILMGPHASEKDRKRFRQEAESVAQLQHPGIVQIYDIGESPTGPFLALEYVAGGSLSERLDGKPWLPQTAAELVEHVTRAVEAAHQAGIIHRDLKPANILVADFGARLTDGKVDHTVATAATGSQSENRNPKSPTPKITDFGLAKRLDSAQGHTASGAILGTPSYMAPEQAEGRSSNIGPATDVYALGAILYELLTGRPPFLAESAFDTIMQVTKQDPVPPSRLNAKVPADLETICLKCLRKEKDRRYLSATALAEDLRCFREGRPISARPVSAIERGWRWCRRNPVVAGLLSAVAILMIAGTSIATYFAVEANNQWREAQASARQARQQSEIAGKNAAEAREAHKEAERGLYAARINLAQNALRENRLIRLRELLLETAPDEGAEDYRGWEWHYLHRQANMEANRYSLMDHARLYASMVAIAPDAYRIAAMMHRKKSDGLSESVLCVIDFRTGQRLLEIPRANIRSAAIALSADGKWLAESTESKIHIWDVDSKATKKEIAVAKGISVHALAFDGAGTSLAISEGSSIRLVEPLSGKVVRTIALTSGAVAYQLTFDENSDRLFFGQTKPASSMDSEIFYVPLPQGAVTTTAGPVPRMPYAPFAVNRNGQTVAIAQGKKRVLVWDHRKRETVHVVPVQSEAIVSIAFVGPQMFAIGGMNGLVSIYHAASTEEPALLRSHTNPVTTIAALKDGRYLTVDASAQVCEWEGRRRELQRMIAQGSDSSGLITAPSFSSAGRLLVHIGGNGQARSLMVWDIVDRTLRMKRSTPLGPQALNLIYGNVAVSGDERVAAAVLVKQENADLLGNAAALLPGLAMRFGGPGALQQNLLNAGIRAFTTNTDVVRLIDLKGNAAFPTVKLPESIQQMYLSGDGAYLLTAGAGWRVHETAKGKMIAGAAKSPDSSSLVALHPNGKQFVVAVSRNWYVATSKRTPASTIAMRSFATNDEMALPLLSEESQLGFMQFFFSSSGRYLGVVAVDPDARQNGISTVMRLLVWKQDENGQYQRMALPNDGIFAPNQIAPAALAFNEIENSAAFVLLAHSQSAEANVWKLGTTTLDSTFRFPSGGVEFAGFTDDGRRLLVASATGTGSDSHTAELRVFDLAGRQELLEIPLGQVVGAIGFSVGKSAYYFDGQTLRVAAWNEAGAEMRIIDGSPRK